MTALALPMPEDCPVCAQCGETYPVPLGCAGLNLEGQLCGPCAKRKHDAIRAQESYRRWLRELEDQQALDAMSDEERQAEDARRKVALRQAQAAWADEREPSDGDRAAQEEREHRYYSHPDEYPVWMKGHGR